MLSAFTKILTNFSQYNYIPISIFHNKKLIFSTSSSLHPENLQLENILHSQFDSLLFTTYSSNKLFSSFAFKENNTVYRLLIGPKLMFNTNTVANQNLNFHFEESSDSFQRWSKLVYSVFYPQSAPTIIVNSVILETRRENKKAIISETNKTDLKYYNLITQLLQLILQGDYANSISFLNKFISQIFTPLSDSTIQSYKNNSLVLLVLIAENIMKTKPVDVKLVAEISDYFIIEIDRKNSLDEIFLSLKRAILRFTQVITDTKTLHSPLIRQAMQYINTHLYSSITITDIATAINITPNYLAKLFKEELKQTTVHYIQARRIEEAKTLLIYSEYTSSEIASLLQFTSQSYFIKIFKQHQNITPDNYRKRRAISV